MSLTNKEITAIVEAALFASEAPLNIKQLSLLFGEEKPVAVSDIRSALHELQKIYAERSIELVEVASGYRFQVRQVYGEWMQRLWEEKPPRYSRALLETLAIICYRQPITRGEIEDIRGVAVSTSIAKTLLERNWIRVVGHKELPGRPAMYGTTPEFLDYFGIKSLKDLPTLAEVRELTATTPELVLDMPVVLDTPLVEEETLQ